MAVTLAESPGNLAGALESRAAEQTNVYEAALFSPDRRVLAVAGIGGSRATPEPPPLPALRLARLQQTYSKIEQAPDGGLVLRVVVPVNTDDALNPLKLLQIVEPVPKSLAQDAERVQAGVRDYQELSFSRTALKRLYALTLTLTLLLALTSALGLAVVLSERFAAPLGLLAEGTRAVAQGDFTRRQPVVSRDELGVLTESFNTMTAQLAEAQGRERGQPARDRDDARLSRKHSRQPFRRRARVRRAPSAAHGQSERGGDPAAAARRPDRACRSPTGASACPRSRRLPSWWRRTFAAAAIASGKRRRSSPSRTCRARC